MSVVMLAMLRMNLLATLVCFPINSRNIDFVGKRQKKAFVFFVCAFLLCCMFSSKGSSLFRVFYNGMSRMQGEKGRVRTRTVDIFSLVSSGNARVRISACPSSTPLGSIDCLTNLL